MPFFTKIHTTLKYYLVTAKRPFAVKTIAPDRTQEGSIAVCYPMIYVNQVCHGLGRCVKDVSCSSSCLEWKSIDTRQY